MEENVSLIYFLQKIRFHKDENNKKPLIPPPPIPAPGKIWQMVSGVIRSI